LQAIFADTAVEHVQWGVKIVSLRDEATLYSLNASRFMVPASNQKLLTAAAAAERLGWEHRFTTRVLATGPLEADGTLKGDLVIVGDGDPTINPRHQARWGVFDQWAARLRARGLTTVAGDLVGDDNAFAEPGWGTGWAWDNLQYGYGAPVGALQYHENQIDVLVSPGAAVGAPAAVTFTPPAGGMQIANHVVTTTAGGRTEVDIARVPGRPILDVRGRIPAGAREVTITAAVDNPTAFYVEAFRAALARHGITVSGRAVDVDELAAPPSFEQAIELVVDRSPPLDEIIDVAMKWSRNGYAETLLLALARERPATPTAGLAALTETLAAWKIPAEAYLPRDGSGLSRYDYVSADALAALLQALAADAAHAAPFRATLPVAGVSGTLADRLKGTPAEGRVVAKTGTLSNVRALSGYLTTLRGEPLAFSILANNFRLPSADIDALVDRALLRLVDFRRQGR
jgi:D-alanyl-D-alanine carboxypeptidase/D-alanyl-D-alanine-endopeptidase (penicillin-binding protein 4)